MCRNLIFFGHFPFDSHKNVWIFVDVFRSVDAVFFFLHLLNYFIPAENVGLLTKTSSHDLKINMHKLTEQMFMMWVVRLKVFFFSVDEFPIFSYV